MDINTKSLGMKLTDGISFEDFDWGLDGDDLKGTFEQDGLVIEVYKTLDKTTLIDTLTTMLSFEDLKGLFGGDISAPKATKTPRKTRKKAADEPAPAPVATDTPASDTPVEEPVHPVDVTEPESVREPEPVPQAAPRAEPIANVYLDDDESEQAKASSVEEDDEF